jgi:hypothetical protein
MSSFDEYRQNSKDFTFGGPNWDTKTGEIIESAYVKWHQPEGDILLTWNEYLQVKSGELTKEDFDGHSST